MIKKMLVANRGEIAVRIMRTCREMGIISVAVYSEADRTAMHVRYADEAYLIGPPPSSESYLHIDRIMEAAKKSGADSIHPGYGFLSENAGFSKRCRDEGIIFVGPSPEAISTMGDKITARQAMIKAGVPVVPGTTEKITDEEEAAKVISRIGLPVMIKASAGGGGKGLRLVHKESEIKPSIRAARSESQTAFGDDSVYIEKYITSPHHIEFQILGDTLGNIIHLFERECSIQRRHQKVIEETPSPLLTPEIREEMGRHAVAAARSVNYTGAGTVEFIVDEDLNFYFLEMNTRLQVEHPITERVVGIDLVREQINIANGRPLTHRQEQLSQTGHAIECRIYAEDPDNNFMPSPGLVKHITEPLGFGVRHDGYVYEGYRIPIYYDPLISKLITWGKTREEAIQRARRALFSYKISGIKTSIKFLERIMLCKDFMEGKYNTHFIEKNKEFLSNERTDNTLTEDISMIVALIHHNDLNDKYRAASSNGKSLSNWKATGRRKSMQKN